MSSQKTEIMILLYPENPLFASDEIMIIKTIVTIMYENSFLQSSCSKCEMFMFYIGGAEMRGRERSCMENTPNAIKGRLVMLML